MLALLLLSVPLVLAVCPNGTVYHPEFGRCYKFSSTRQSFELAESDCLSLGGHLVSVQNGYENSMLIEAMRFLYPFFIGLSDLGGNWTWIDNTPVTYTNWAKGQPNGINQCVISALDNGFWSANSCFERLPYVCAISANPTPPTSCPPPPVCPSQPACTQCPSQQPSCPAPSVVDRCPSEWTYFTETNSCYKTFLAASFDDAEHTCVVRGSHLASIHSSSENRFVAGLTRTGEAYGNPSALTWIGLRQVGFLSSTPWTWTDGTNVDYTNWALGEPDNADGNEHCVQIYSDHNGADPTKDTQFQQWNDYYCSETMRAFVCKKPASY